MVPPLHLSVIKYLVIILLYVLVVSTKSAGQGLTLVSESKVINSDTSLIYHYAGKRDEFMGADLYMYANGSFFFRSYTDLAYWISAGTWIRSGDTLSFTSEFRKGLPVLVSYLPPPSGKTVFKNFAIIKDLAGKEYTKGAIHVNNDSVSCFYGDMECFGTYKTIDSVKVTLNDELTSGWIKVDSSKGVIQLIVQTRLDLEHYLSFDGKFLRENNTLKRMDE